MTNLEWSFWKWITEEGGLEDFIRCRMNSLTTKDSETGEVTGRIYFTPDREYHGFTEERAIQAEAKWLMESREEPTKEDRAQDSEWEVIDEDEEDEEEEPPEDWDK